MAELLELALSVVCPTCAAAEGMECCVPTTRELRTPHMDRVELGRMGTAKF